MRLFGLIGYPLSHSFSKAYFTQKFEKEGIADCRYDLFELKSIEEFPALLKDHPELAGLNVTIPYKQQVQQYIHLFDDSATQVGAVNVIRVNRDHSLTGFNSDYYGFRTSLRKWLPGLHFKALILGSGGASKAVAAALKDLRIPFELVSRSVGKGSMTYAQLEEDPGWYDSHRLIINTTPAGMSPNIDQAPPISYEYITKRHYLYDLVYNPEETKFMRLGLEKGANVKNGLEMLHLQAEKSWEIWGGENASE